MSLQSLEELGDPSGHQDASYWNEWFEIVCCRRKHQAFEWYCSAEEVARILSLHLANPSIVSNNRMIHPGCGTSLVPLFLSKIFPHHHVAVDVSQVAVDEFRNHHDKEQNVEYIASDLLKPPLPFEELSFDCWIDKGFVDAVFAEGESSAEQAKRLFDEIHRLLIENGVALVVSLAEEHSLRIILDNWTESGWSPLLHVWELKPVSGAMLPFGFVLSKSHSDQTRSIAWHGLDGSVEILEGDVQRAIVHRVQRSRDAFQKQAKATVRMVLATIDVKVYDPDFDLVALSSAIQSQDWFVDGTVIAVKWRTISGSTCEIVPVGFGISKLRMTCAIDSDDLGLLIDVLSEHDDIQSVDVDWNETAPLSDAAMLPLLDEARRANWGKLSDHLSP